MTEQPTKPQAEPSNPDGRSALEQVKDERMAEIYKSLKESAEKTPEKTPQDTKKTETLDDADPTILLCPTCKKSVEEHHKDDIQTWYACEDGHQTATPLKKKIPWEIDAAQKMINNYVKWAEAHPELVAEYERKRKEQQDNYDAMVQTVETTLGEISWRVTVSEDEPFNPSNVADDILYRYHYGIVTDKTTETIYFYTEGEAAPYYHKDGEVFLEVLLGKVLGSEARDHRIKEIIALIKIKTKATLTPSKKITVENGILNLETQTIELFTKMEFIPNRLHVAYKADAKSEAWENFIDEVCPNDKLLLQEWSGYLLLRGYPFHVIMWLYGPTGRNGKGVWARTMQGILGKENCSSVQIHEFNGGHRFAAYNLRDSMFNISSEPRTDHPLTIEMLQSLSGQDTIDAEKKTVQERFKLDNTAKLTVMGNKFPNIDNPTEAFWQRLKLCSFPNQFIGKDQIQDLEKTWLDDPEQRSGILNWMITGLQRLLSNHGFTLTTTQQETIIQFKRASDSTSAFLIEGTEFSPESWVSKVAMYDYYKTYCDTIGIQPAGQAKFNDRLRQSPKIREFSTRIGVGTEKKQVKGWKGIKFKDLPKDPEDPDPPEKPTKEKKKPHTPPVDTKQGTLPVTNVTDVTTSHTPENSDNLKKIEEVDGKKSVTSVTTVTEIPEETIDAYCQGGCLRCDTQECPKPIYSIPPNAKVPKRCTQYSPSMTDPDCPVHGED